MLAGNRRAKASVQRPRPRLAGGGGNYGAVVLKWLGTYKGMKSRIIVKDDLQTVPEGSDYPVPSGFVVSDLAREEAARRNIRLVEREAGMVAIGADHGGFAMKEALKPLLGRLGHAFHDFGAFDEKPVDYPDIALNVALAVSRGQCRVGILIDGAGIGSCMAANKVSGVLAALCYDEATARNSREHNYANVLTLGGKLISPETMEAIVKTWLATPYGEERHRRRVDKIRQIERRYGGPSS